MMLDPTFPPPSRPARSTTDGRCPTGRRPKRTPALVRAGTLLGALVLALPLTAVATSGQDSGTPGAANGGGRAAPQAIGDETTFPPPTDPPRLRVVTAIDGVLLDGRLDEPAWQLAEPAARFRQIEPLQGQEASEPTEVRVLQDDRFLYFGVRVTDSAAPRVRDLRRDFAPEDGDLFGIVLDPFGNGRVAWAFEINPSEAQRDLQIVDGRSEESSWDAVWFVRTARDAQGWTAEVAIPWSSLRYERGSDEWRVNFQRRLRRANELAGWAPWPRSLTPYRTAYAGILEGVSPPPLRRNLRFQPYLLGRSERAQGRDRRGDVDLGLDLKWLPSPSTVVDLTYNTDFAQTEVDAQIVNLSRFSVFFPEKRQFFLESAGIFDASVTRWIMPFFSRRIGLDQRGRPVPIDGGARVVSQNGEATVGGLLMRTAAIDETPASTFAVGRYVYQLGPARQLGGVVAARFDDSVGEREAVSNVVGGIDYLHRPNENLTIDALVTGSSSSDEDGDGWAGALWVSYRPNWGYLGWLQYVVSPDYRPDSGFLTRSDLVLTSPAANLDWRPSWRPHWLRSLNPGFALYAYHSYDDLDFEQSDFTLTPLDLRLHDGGSVKLDVTWSRQDLERSFRPLSGIDIVPGDYAYRRVALSARTDPSRGFSLWLRVAEGGYYDGDLSEREAALNFGPSPSFNASLTWARNELRDLGPERVSRDTDLASLRLRWLPNPRFQLSTFLQHNTAAELENWQLRLSWEYRPLSYLHLVYGREAPTDPGAGFIARPDETANRIILKVSLLRGL